MRLSHRSFASLVLCLGSVTCMPASRAAEAMPVQAASLTTSDAYAVRTAIDGWMGALSARDAAAASRFVEAGVLGVYQGAAGDYDGDSLSRSLALTMRSQGEQGVWANEVEEIGGSGDVAVVRSKRTLTRSADSGSSAVMTLRLLEVWQRYSDGSWRLARFLGFPG